MPAKLIEIYHPGFVDIETRRSLRKKETDISFGYCSLIEMEYILYRDKGVFFDLSDYSIDVQVCKISNSKVKTLWSTENGHVVMKNAAKGYFTIRPSWVLLHGDYKCYVAIKNKSSNKQETIDCRHFSIKDNPCPAPG
jgi:hypothetical protein